MRISLLFYFVENRICSVITIYINISGFIWMKLRIEQIVINYSGTSNANEENNSQYAENIFFFSYSYRIFTIYKVVPKLRRFQRCLFLDNKCFLSV